MGMTPILKVSYGVVHQIGSLLCSTNTVMKVTFYGFREVARRELGRRQAVLHTGTHLCEFVSAAAQSSEDI